MSAPTDQWVMPEWMEPYRGQLADYGLGAEDLMNDQDSSFFNNEYRAALIVSFKDQVALLTRLRDSGLLHVPGANADLTALQRAVRPVVQALEDPGPNPEYHRSIVAKLCREWPTLANALSILSHQFRNL